MAEGKSTAVITGASRGIGRATALRLAARYDIVALARTASDLETLRAEIERAGGRCRPIALDITDAGAVERALRDVDAHVLVNNAGIGMLKPLLELSIDEWRRMVSTNLDALFYVTRMLLPKMVARREGDIVTIGSLAGRNPFVGGACYGATKHAVVGFSESLMLEVRDAGVRVAMVMPGSVDTRFGAPKSDTSWMLTADQVAGAVATILETPRSELISRIEMRPATPKPHR